MSQYLESLKHLTGTMVGIGRFPVAPGTFASFMTILLAYLGWNLLVLPRLEIEEIQMLLSDTIVPDSVHFLYFFVLVSLCSFGVLWSAPACEKKWGKDPAPVVLDEAAGQLLIMAFLPLTGQFDSDLLLLFFAFILFRFFDILKPLGIRSLQHINGGFGILIDDLVAGFYSVLLLLIVLHFI